MNKFIRNVGNEEYLKTRTPEKIIESEYKHIQEKKKSSVFNISRLNIIYFTVAVATVLLINTVMVVYVNNSLNEIHNLQKDLNDKKQKNEILIREINYLESPERITEIATSKLNLIQSKEAPKFLKKNIEK